MCYINVTTPHKEYNYYVLQTSTNKNLKNLKSKQNKCLFYREDYKYLLITWKPGKILIFTLSLNSVTDHSESWVARPFSLSERGLLPNRCTDVTGVYKRGFSKSVQTHTRMDRGN